MLVALLALLDVNGVNNLLASCLGDLARRLLTPFTSRSARRSSTLFVRKLISSIITVSMLLEMNQMLLLDLLAFMKNTRVKAMVMDTKEGIRSPFFCYQYIENKQLKLKKK